MVMATAFYQVHELIVAARKEDPEIQNVVYIHKYEVAHRYFYPLNHDKISSLYTQVLAVYSPNTNYSNLNYH